MHRTCDHTYKDRSPRSWSRGCSPNLLSPARVNTLARSNACNARQCKSVGNQLLETIIDVARNASTLHAVFAPREIRARLSKILQRRSRTIIVPTCPEYQRMLEKSWPPLSQPERDIHTAMKSRLATPLERKLVRSKFSTSFIPTRRQTDLHGHGAADALQTWCLLLE